MPSMSLLNKQNNFFVSSNHKVLNQKNPLQQLIEKEKEKEAHEAKVKEFLGSALEQIKSFNDNFKNLQEVIDAKQKPQDKSFLNRLASKVLSGDSRQKQIDFLTLIQKTLPSLQITKPVSLKTIRNDEVNLANSSREFSNVINGAFSHVYKAIAKEYEDAHYYRDPESSGVYKKLKPFCKDKTTEEEQTHLTALHKYLTQVKKNSPESSQKHEKVLDEALLQIQQCLQKDKSNSSFKPK